MTAEQKVQLETKVIRLNNNRDKFNGKEQTFIESLIEFFYSKGFLSAKQQVYIDKFCTQLDNLEKALEANK